ncbi:MAG: DNA-3-methyladenine glycosylase I [Parcubacteria group bacterium]|nr:DNA-3-methyladenine glycosylase I [Parcubacteria group bacterium]
MKEINTSRCSWPGDDELMIKYHDKEWGSPCHNDRIHFEYLILDSFQAGLSWRTILHKRENFRRAFGNFNPKVIAGYDAKKIRSLMKDPGIVRNRLKIESAVKNAKAFLKIQKEFGSFNKYIWRFTDGKTIDGKQKTNSGLRSKSKESDAMSRDLKKRGFVFVGSTICYAYMQGAGMVNDHLIKCFRHKLKIK